MFPHLYASDEGSLPLFSVSIVFHLRVRRAKQFLFASDEGRSPLLNVSIVFRIACEEGRTIPRLPVMKSAHSIPCVHCPPIACEEGGTIPRLPVMKGAYLHSMR